MPAGSFLHLVCKQLAPKFTELLIRSGGIDLALEMKVNYTHGSKEIRTL